MTPIKHPFCNTVLGPPVGQENKTHPLPIQRHDSGVVSFWSPNDHEKGVIQQGGCVAINVFAVTHPPLLVTTVPHLSTAPIPPISDRISQATVALAAHLEASRLQTHEIGAVLGFLVGQLAEHTRVPLYTLLGAIGDAAKSIQTKARRNPSHN